MEVYTMDKFEETVNELKTDIEDLDKEVESKLEGLDEDKKARISELVEKAKTAINTSIEKVSAVINEIDDSEKLDDLLDKIKAKAKEAVDYTTNKIDALINGEKTVDIDRLHDDIMAEFDKVKENEVVRKTTVLIKEGYAKINEFFEKPEVQDTIKKAKKTTIMVAEKGVEGLKKVLDVKDDEVKSEEPENKEEN